MDDAVWMMPKEELGAVIPEQSSTPIDAGESRAGTVVVVVGPTAVGKSDLGLALGQRLGGELISADSRQIYRYLDIGTAKPTVAERLLIPHHLVDIVTPDQEYTLASFQEDAYRAIAGAQARGRLPFLVGGTGLYVRAVVEGLRMPRIAPHPELRAALEERAAREGSTTLHRQLQSLDPRAAARIDARNVRRLVRALEVCLVAGRPISELQRAQPPGYDFVFLGLTCRRETLYRRIDERVDRQVASGLVEETRRAVALGYGFDAPAMTGLGQRQIGLYLQGKLSLAEAIELDKYDTHRFVRHQYTWFCRGDPRIHWLDRDELGWDALVRRAEAIIQQALDEKYGRMCTMKTTIDVAGRLVIPREIRRQAGLRPGMPLEVRWCDGRIEIEPAVLPVKLVRKGRLLVAVPEMQVEQLTADTVEETRQAIAGDRGAGT